jgi:hypothetical protein
MTEPSGRFLAANLASLDQPTAARIAASSVDGVTCLDRGGVPVLAIRSATGAYVACHGRHEPVQEASEWLPPLGDGAAFSLLFVIGASCGYLLDAIERHAAPTTRVIAIEPEPAAVRWLLERRDWRPWLGSGRLRFVLGPDYAGAASVWKLFEPGTTDPPIVVHPVLARTRPGDVSQCDALAKRIAFDARANADAREQLAAGYLEHTLRNVGTIALEGDAGALVDRFRGVPAIIVAAGPSLDRNIDDLARVGTGALVLAVDTACHPLLAAGIAPDIVHAVDPSLDNAEHFRGLPDTSRSWLVAEASLDPSSFKPFVDRTFTFNVSRHHPWPWLSDLGLTRATLSVWGSVLTGAFDLALKMGCDPIVFAGADLGFTGGQPYCRRTVFEARWANLRSSSGSSLAEVWRQETARTDPIELRDLTGAPVLTSRSLLAFRDWIVGHAAAHPDRRIVNATGAGMLFGGSIGQASLLELLPAGGNAAKDVQETLQRIHAESVAASKPAREAVMRQCDISAVRDRIEEWTHFAGGRLARERVADALSLSRELIASGRPRRVNTGLSRAGWPPVPDRFRADWCEAIARAEEVVPEQAPISRGDLLDVVDLSALPAGSTPFDALDREPFVKLTLSIDQIAHESGCCYVFLFRTAAGRLFSFNRIYARLSLFEDGTPLAHAGARHDAIRAVGGGRYSLWPLAIFFSSSDGSDPRTNGRQYHIQAPKHLHLLEQMPQALIERFGL